MHDAGTNYRAFLKREFAARCERNALYSLRAFARDLSILPSRLSDVLNGKQGLSAASASKLARRLSLSAQEQEWFTAAVESQHGRSKLRRHQAKATLEKIEDGGRYQQLREDVFAVVADWYHFAILELTTQKSFQPDPKWIAQRLGIATAIVEVALERLIAVGLLRNVGKTFEATSSFVASPEQIPSEAIKRHHRQMLEKATAALTLQPVTEREFSTNTLSIDPNDLPAIKADLKAFRRRLERKYAKSAHRSQVYCLAQQFFSLTPESK